MTTKIASPKRHEFSLVNTKVSEKAKGNDLIHESDGFYFLALDLILGLTDEDADDCITDNRYLQVTGHGGHDRGVDAIYIDDSVDTPNVHIFNCKYTEKFEKTTSHFPSGEIDKIHTFLDALMSEGKEHFEDANPVLKEKVEAIIGLYDKKAPNITIHFCSNLYNGMVEDEYRRLKGAVDKTIPDSKIIFHNIDYFVQAITHKNIKKCSGKIRGIDKRLFEKSDGNIRALIADFDARDILRIVTANDEIRDNVELTDYSELLMYGIIEDVFADNVRMYMQQKTPVNRSIKKTALSDDKNLFFYFNNGITITCSKFSYPKNKTSPIIELNNICIVNGSQTVHSLYDAFKQSPEDFENINLLCKIYETTDSILSTKIAETTNSQNPVTSRDIRSNDPFQQSLEQELLSKGYFYERKKNQYQSESRSRRMDAEKAGQTLLAFFNEQPDAAKDKKRLIFSDYYGMIFSDIRTADDIIVSHTIYKHIEKLKSQYKRGKAKSKKDENSFLLHSSFYILYTISLMARSKGISLTPNNIDLLISFYEPAVSLIKQFVEEAIRSTPLYDHRIFFKGSSLAELIRKQLKSNTK